MYTVWQDGCERYGFLPILRITCSRGRRYFEADDLAQEAREEAEEAEEIVAEAAEAAVEAVTEAAEEAVDAVEESVKEETEE